MVINVTEKTLIKNNNKFKLKNDEMKLLLLLSDAEIHSKKEILEYMNITEGCFQYLKKRLWDKYSIGLHIRYFFGYKISNEIAITK